MLNKAMVIGNLGRDPELRYAGETPVCNLAVATSRKFKKRDGSMEEETEWHRVTVWGKQAETCNTYLEKGRKVYVEGRIHTSSYEDKDGVKKYSTEIVAERVQFLSGKGESAGAPSGGGELPYDGGSYSSTPKGVDDDIPF